ncbi:hypothetical protein OG552_36145 [Streptomyces sp. NBC_01476]|uniref:hypothetical protein n=1 Tax=Streptomyces sp. NBC_01476 TaxID=2903881 RepID=UPI002E301131|nr:hypothetical protein [Streptomyces sp. NBC_01476]
MRSEKPATGSDVVETSMPEVLEALANRLEGETAASLEALSQQAVRLREETAATVASLREQAARLRDERDFSR